MVIQQGTAADMVSRTAPLQRSHPASRWGGALLSPVAIVAVAVALAIALLCLPVSVPIGPMYWDLYVVVDGAYRVLQGQIPAVDFFAPVGPLGYWLAAAGMALFPSGQLLLVSQWTLMAVTLPPLLVVLVRVDQANRAMALALLVPFLAYQLLPLNVEIFTNYPAFDGFGIYNRQGTELLYVLATILVFERRTSVLALTLGWTCLCLFLLKVTGFIAGGLLCAFAFAAGRVSLRAALGAVLVFAVPLVAFEALWGLSSNYVSDIASLVARNQGALLPRFLQAGSIHFGVFGTGCLLAALLLWLDRSLWAKAGGRLIAARRLADLHAFLDRYALWLGAGLLAGLFYETQNTGGQAFIFLWPIILPIAATAWRGRSAATLGVCVLSAAVLLPPLVTVLHRATRAVIGQTTYQRIVPDRLKGLAQVSQRPEVLHAAQVLQSNYARFPETYEDFARQGELPSFTLYTSLDFQVAWLLAADEAVNAVHRFENENGVRFETVLNLNFVNPFPYLLDRQGPRLVAIGADPFRAVPDPDAQTLAAVAATDLVLYPTCPVTDANNSLRKLYAPALTRHRLVTLSPCWQAYIRPDLPGLPPA